MGPQLRRTTVTLLLKVQLPPAFFPLPVLLPSSSVFNRFCLVCAQQQINYKGVRKPSCHAGDNGTMLITKDPVDSHCLEEPRLAQKRSPQREGCLVKQFTADDTDLIGIKNMSSTGKIIFM